MTTTTEAAARETAVKLLARWKGHDGGSAFYYTREWIDARNALEAWVAASQPVTSPPPEAPAESERADA